MSADIEPDDAEVVQEEAAAGLTCIPVVVEGPVRTQALPSKASGMRRITLSATEPQMVLGRDPRRRRALLQAYDAEGLSGGAFLGTSRNEANPPSAFAARLGLSLPAATAAASAILELTSQDEVWAVAAGEACELTIIAEQWAD